MKHLYLAFEHKAYEIVIYGINGRNLEGIARVTDSNFSLGRNRAITSYVVRVNSHVSVYMHFCVPSWWILEKLRATSCSSNHPWWKEMSARLRLFRVSQQLSRNFRSSCSCFRMSFSFSRSFITTTRRNFWTRLLHSVVKTTSTNILIYSRGPRCSSSRTYISEMRKNLDKETRKSNLNPIWISWKWKWNLI